MRTILYSCDYCKKETTKRHLSINFNPDGYSGYVKPDEDGYWEHIANAVRPDMELAGGKLIKQFCSTRCLSKYFLRKEI